LDFISCYAENYQLPFINLHGKNDLMYGEIASRKMISQDAIKDLVVKGLVDAIVFLRKIITGGADKSYGIQVAKLAGVPDSVTNRAKELIEELSSADIATRAREIAEAALNLFKKYTDEELDKMIQKDGIDAIRKGARNCIT